MCDKTNTSSRAILVLVGLFAASPVASQAPAFDAASVRPTQMRRPGGGDVVFLPGRFTATHEVVPTLIAQAYNVEDYRVVGGPPWLATERFDIDARAGRTVTVDETRLMLRTLLADRFKLRLRIESRQMPTHALVVSRTDGRPGPRLRPAAPEACGDRTPCGRLFTNWGSLTGRSVPMSLLATRLSSITRRVVADRTNLTGLFDVDAEWGLTEAEYAEFLQTLPPTAKPGPFDPSRPSLFTALDEQLGLQLESITGPVDVVVIDSVERPTEN